MRDFLLFQSSSSSSSSSSLFLVAFELSKKKELCGNWNILEEVVGKKGKKGKKKKKREGYVCGGEKKRGKKKKEIWIKK